MIRSHETDGRLLTRCISGDREASEQFVRRFSALVYGTIRNTLIVKQTSFIPQDLEDFHNTTFLHLFEHGCKKLRQYRGKNGCSVASWIRLIAVRCVLNHLRKKGIDAIGSEKNKMSLEETCELESSWIEPWAALERKEKEYMIQNGIENLPPRDRLFMKLHFQKDLSVEEIADAMNLSIQNVYTVKHRAVERLRAQIDSHLNG